MTMLVPEDFVVPLRLEQPEFVLRPLLIGDVVKDYDAVMSSVAHLQGVFGPGSDWPPSDLSFEQDLIDLGWHHKEFQRRSSFAYTVVAPDESLCVGCAYIYPSRDPAFDAEAYCWTRASHAELGRPLYDAFRRWLATAWPFRQVAFPGKLPGKLPD
jgi:hypothetical protein